MKGDSHEVDAQRARWSRHRRGLALSADAGSEFAKAGLAGHMDQLDVRFVILSADPEADVVPLDLETLTWLKELRDSSHGGRPFSWGSMERATSGALVLYDQYRSDGWVKYVALHRHGGLEIGMGGQAYQVPSMGESVRIFPLLSIVGAARLLTALQVAASDRWPIDGPYELTLAVRDAGGATLGNFASGWAEPGRGLFEFTTCLEDNLLLRYEVEVAVDPDTYAADVGDRLEQAFGSVHRRHIARGVGET